MPPIPTDDATGSDQPSQARPSRQGIGTTLLSACVGALVCGGGVGAYFLWFNPTLSTQSPHTPADLAVSKDNTPSTYFFEIPDIIVNLQATEGVRRHFLKLKIILEVNNPEELKILEKIRPRLIDQMQIYLRALKIADLEGMQGAIQLRENLLMRIQTVASPVVIKQILFKDLLVQ